MTDAVPAYAVVRVGGQQYKVSAGESIVVDRVPADEGASITLEALAVRTPAGTLAAGPAAQATVTARVAEHVLGEKVRVFTYKPKTTYKRARGHRSRLSRLVIESITLKGEKEKKGGA